MEIAVNEFQTPITDELLDSLSTEAREQFLDYITNVEFIKRLISPDRPRAKDLPRRDGKIIVDIVNPHILEDMEYFRPVGNFYRKHGVLTKLRPNPSPNSDYGKWMETEINRIWYGMVRESDGEWITGNMYFYLNYTPIIQSRIRKGTKLADRVIDFPEVWEGSYLWFHYIDQARNGGLYNNWLGGEHAVQIARRGAGKSYTAAAILGKAFICGENHKAHRKVKGAVTAYQKEYLVKDGILNKFVDIIDFCAENTEFPASRIKDSINDMHWMMGYKDSITNTNKGTMNEILGISAKDDTDKCHPYSCNVPTPNGTKKWGDIKVGDSLFDAYGNPTKVLKIFEHSEDDIYKITLKDGRCTYATKNHLWEITYRSAGKFKTRLEPTEFLINNTIFINDKYNLFKWGIRKNGCVQYKEQDLKINPYTMGLFLGDGCYSKSHNNYLDITMLVEDILNLLPYIKYPVKISKYRDITHHIILDSNSRQLLNHYGLKDKNHGNKFIPKEYLINSEANRIELLNGLLDSDGSCTKDYGVIEYSTKSILLRKGFLELCRSLGFNCSYKEKKINGLIYQKCYIYTDDKRLFNLKRKKDRLKVSSSNYSKSFSDKTHIVSVEFSHRDKSKCVIVDNPEHLYLIDDFIVTHNSRGKRSNYFIYEEFGAFPKFIDIWNVNKSNVLEDDVIFGQAIAFGCVCADTMVYDKNGKPYLIQDITKDKGILGFKENAANIENITYILDYAEKECVEITHSYGKLRCSIDHPILCKVPVRSRKENKRWYETKFVPANLIKEHYTIAEIDIIDIWGKELMFDPYLVGLLIGDGSYGKDKTPVISNCDEDVLTYISNNYNTEEELSRLTKNLKPYKELRIKGICSKLKEIGIYGQTKSDKRLPLNYLSLNKENSSLLLAGLFDTDGYVGKNNITLVQSSYEILDLILQLLRKFGILGKIHKVKSSKYSTNIDRESNTFIYVLEVKDKRSLYNFYNNIPVKIKYKIEALNNLITQKPSDNIRWRKIHHIKSIGILRIYNLTADDSHTYIANNIITHNTGGSEGSDFSGALEMIYNPIGYQVYPLPNVFDKNSQGKQMTVFFFGAYLNRKGCYNENGVSDVVMALLQEIQARIKIKYNSTDTMTLTRKKAEQAITILEAVMKRDGTFYPIADLTDVHNELEFNPRLLDSIGVGELSITKTNEIVFKPTNDAVPIREFPHKDNKLLGCVEVHRPPVRDSSGKVMHGRYIAGIDPYDDDASDTLSLGALTILDLFTDLIVFEYTGRPMFADDFYETCRRALIWYNAECNYENNKKGLFKYFSQHNSLYLLSDTLDFLKDKELMKPGLYGNKAKGTISSAPIKAYGRRCIRDWLLKPVTITLVIDREEVDVTVPALTQMKTKALLKELMLWNPDGNFDRHDALAMLMLLREEKLRVFGVLSPTEALNNTAEGYLGNDSYFETNYDKKFAGKTRMPSYFNKQ